MSGRAIWMGLLAIAILGVVLLAGANPRVDGPALDPRTTSGRGTRALVLLLEEFEADVSLDRSLAGRADVALLLDDRLTDLERSDLVNWMSDGGTLVLTDPFSELAPPLDTGGGQREPGRCSIEPLVDIENVTTDSGFGFEVPSGADSCFGDGRAALVTSERRGRGTLVSIAGANAFTNDELAEADNAFLAVALLAPRPGTKVAFVTSGETFGGDSSLSDLVSPAVKLVLGQLAIAFLMYALWRSRRIGDPVAETDPVELDGSDLVAAVGQLLQRTRDPAKAAELLRRDAVGEFRRLLGVSPDATPEVIALVIADRMDESAEDLRRVLADGSITTDEGLVNLARRIESLRQELSYVGSH